MRLKLIPESTSFDFFKRWKLWLGISAVMIIVGFASFALQGLNY
ncbi:MAG: protein translocase subunit SecF, partial [Pseudomonadota bacterium]|nr:protein translocase subunit SecF [Pseudomonadota bacterium]